jgi:hypothetical protein
MRMAAALSLSLALGACVQPVAQASGRGMAGPLRVSDDGKPFAMDQGLKARRAGEVICSRMGQRLQSSIYDRFDNGEWLFIEGCV